MAHLGGIMDAVFGSQVRETVKAVWTGVMGFTTDGLPLIGQLPRAATLREGDEEWIATGDNGYGMANAWLSGKHVVGCVLQEKDVETIPSA